MTILWVGADALYPQPRGSQEYNDQFRLLMNSFVHLMLTNAKNFSPAPNHRTVGLPSFYINCLTTDDDSGALSEDEGRRHSIRFSRAT